MKRSDLFMNAVYAAIADQQIPMISGFGNGVDRRGNDYIDEVLRQYPILNDYMDGTKEAFNKYTCYKNSWN